MLSLEKPKGSTKSKGSVHKVIYGHFFLESLLVDCIVDSGVKLGKGFNVLTVELYFYKRVTLTQMSHGIEVRVSSALFIFLLYLSWSEVEVLYN